MSDWVAVYRSGTRTAKMRSPSSPMSEVPSRKLARFIFQACEVFGLKDRSAQIDLHRANGCLPVTGTCPIKPNDRARTRAE
jgi:hypothetical protein